MDQLSIDEVKQINDMIDANCTDLDIAKAFSITKRTVYAIRRNRYNPHHGDIVGEITNLIDIMQETHENIMSRIKQIRKRIEDERN